MSGLRTTVPATPPAIAVAPATPAGSRAPVTPRRSDVLVPGRRFAARLSGDWAPALAWHVGRTGRPGLVGIGLLVASALFFLSTHLEVANEAASLRADLSSARARAAAAPRLAGRDAAPASANLPKRADMPALLGVLIKQADEAHLTLEAGKYETTASKTGEITRYTVSFPVSGPYPQIRQFIDATLTALPAVAISDLSLERKTIGEGTVNAQIRLTVFTRSTP
jgi:hypothetical protein